MGPRDIGTAAVEQMPVVERVGIRQMNVLKEAVQKDRTRRRDIRWMSIAFAKRQAQRSRSVVPEVVTRTSICLRGVKMGHRVYQCKLKTPEE